MAFSLQSRRKHTASAGACAVLIILISIACVLQSYISFNLQKSKDKMTGYLSDICGYRLSLDGISYSFFGGLHLRGLAIFYTNQPRASVFISDARVIINPLRLIFRQFSVSKITIYECGLLSKKEEGGLNLQIILSDISKNLSRTKDARIKLIDTDLSIRSKSARLDLIDDRFLYRGMYIVFKDVRISRYRSGKAAVKGEAKFSCHIPEGHYSARFLNNRDMEQGLKFNFQATAINANDLNIDMLSLDLGDGQLIGTGLVKDYLGRNPYNDIAFIPSNIALEAITFLKENFNPRGQLFLSLRLNGLTDNMAPVITAITQNCSVRYHIANGEIFDIRNMSGKIDYASGLLELKDMSLKFNSLPIEINLKSHISEEPDMIISLSLPKDFLAAQNLPLQSLKAVFNGTMIKNTLTGKLEISSTYIRKNLNLTLAARLSGVDFDYYSLKDKYFRAKELEFIKDNKGAVQKLNFSNFNTNVIINKDFIHAKDISAQGYNGALNGKLIIDLKARPNLQFSLSCQDLNIDSLMRDVNITKKISRGTLEGKLTFNNSLKEFLMGSCYIRNGTVQLEALSETVKLPPLQNVAFRIMHIYFAILKESIKVRGVKLSSPDVSLNAYWDTNRIVKGALNIKLKSELLRKSPQFKKLLDLARTNTAYVDFRFLMGGIPRAVRILWMKGEFKEKITAALPGWVKRSIESNLNDAIEDLSAQ